MSLNFTKITETFSGMDPATKANPLTGIYDLTTMTGS
jgi:hypothetical protein